MQAFELDAALAYRYSVIEKDELWRQLHDIREAIKLTGRYHGIKKIKYKKYKSDAQQVRTMSDEDDTPEEQIAPTVDSSQDLIKLTKGTVIDNGFISRSGV